MTDGTKTDDRPNCQKCGRKMLRLTVPDVTDVVVYKCLVCATIHTSPVKPKPF